MKVVFLDIDGVLQPCSSQIRHQHIAETIEIALKLNTSLHNGFDYLSFIQDGIEIKKDFKKYGRNCFDVAAVWFDWRKESVVLLKRLLDEENAKIVLSSDWRNKGTVIMKALLAIQGLDTYYYDSTMSFQNFSYADHYNVLEQWKPIDRIIKSTISYTNDKVFYNERAGEILEYLDRHKEITSYVAIDDINLSLGLGSHFVFSDEFLTKENYNQMKNILKIEDGPYFLPDKVPRKQLEEWRLLAGLKA